MTLLLTSGSNHTTVAKQDNYPHDRQGGIPWGGGGRGGVAALHHVCMYVCMNIYNIYMVPPPSDLPIFLLSAQVRSSAWTCRLELGFRVRV